MKLKMYPHQVTGHACLLTTEDGSTIGKPVSRGELVFYKTLDPVLTPFVPDFKGVGYVTMETNQHGNEYFSVVSCEFDMNRIKADTDLHKTTNDVFYRGLDRNEYVARTNCFSPNEYVTNKNQSLSPMSMGHTPWAGKLKNVGREKFKAEKGNPLHFLFLENMSKQFQYPCIMDLKLGTRIYGDKCSKRKREKHIRKNAITTTSKVGLRLTGLQVFHKDQFTCKDKFYGRGLSEKGLINEIGYFVKSSNQRSDQILRITIQKLKRLRKVIKLLDGYRFYGTSLLIVYGGEQDLFNENEDSVAVKIVDFCHSTHEHMTGNEIKHYGCDHGALFGITNLIQILEDIQNNLD